MTEHAKRPIFSYIVTVLSASVPTFVMSILGFSLVLTSSETDEALSFIDLYFPAFILGAVANLICSWVYFFKIQKKQWRPRWWSNLLLIILSYAAVPLFSLQISAADPGPDLKSANAGMLFFEVLILSIIGFTIITRVGRKNKTPRKPRFLSPFWILMAIPAYYFAFLFCAITSVNLLKADWEISGYTLYLINLILRFPFLTDVTMEFVKTHLPGPLGNIATISNALFWGTIIWVIRRKRAKRFDAHGNN